jgi:hypothetical protein
MESEQLRIGRWSCERARFLQFVCIATSILALATLFLNRHSVLVGGILHRFENQAEIIKGGFDPSLAIDSSTLTYPMWGYGWLYTVTQQRYVLMTGQMVLAVVASLFFMRVIGRATSVHALILLGIGLCIAIPWYSLHASVTLYAPSSSLLIVAIAMFLLAHASGDYPWRWAALSGIVFGICLNFRSDFVMMPIGIVAITQVYRRHWQGLVTNGIWLASIAVMMIPWMIYTNHVVGKPILTSTNGGHAMFVGLGQLPGNLWGIEPHDRDPIALEIIAEELGPAVSTLSYPADRLLRRKFREYVAAAPVEFARKVGYQAVRVVVQGAYPGEFLNTADHAVGREELVPWSKQLLRNPIAYYRTFGARQLLIHLLVLGSYALTLGTLIGSFLVFPLNAWQGLREGNLAVLIILACIVYQVLLQTMVFNLPQYSNCFFMFHLANVAIAYHYITMFRQTRHA